MAGLAIGAVGASVFQRPGLIAKDMSRALVKRANAESSIANAVMGGNGDENQAIFELFQANALHGLLQNFYQAAIERVKEYLKMFKSVMGIGVSN